MTVSHRPAGALLIAGGVIFFVAEFVAAAAWTDPPYSYTHHFISNLGVHGPSEAFGQFMYSPLAVVMNTGFFLFGLAALAGVLLLRRGALLVPALSLAVGGVLLALFPGSGEAMDDGTGAYHGIGAYATIVGGNVLVLLLGRMQRSRLLVGLGVAGLVSLAAFLAVVMSGAGVLIGLVERGAVYPFLVGLICAGAAIRGRWPAGADRGTAVPASASRPAAEVVGQ